MTGSGNTTSIRGVTILKLPQTKSRPASLAIEINPLTDKGTPMKKKGVMIMGQAELNAFRESSTTRRSGSCSLLSSH